jgi:nucleoside-diphosphate-sugar epimerase
MILVTGATGTVGSEVVKRLSAHGVQVRAVTRDPRKAEANSLPHVEGDLLLLRVFCRVGQQESPVHAGARRPHRLGIVKIALDKLDVRQ